MEHKLSIDVIVASLPGHIYWKDKNGRYLGCNLAQAQSLGFKQPQDIVGKTDFELPWPEGYAEVFFKHDMEVFRTGQSKIIEEPSIINGEEKAVLSHKQPLLDKTGKIIGVLGISVDISQLKKAQEQLKAAKDTAEVTLDNIIACMPGYVYWLDRNHVFLGCNDIEVKAAGLSSRDDIIGKTNYDLPWWEQADELNRINDEVMRTGQEYSVEEICVLADGTKGTYLSKKVPLRDNKENIIGTIGISFDITERKKMEYDLKIAKEQAEKSKQQEEELRKAVMVLAGSIAHDLRTPLVSVGAIGYTLNEILPILIDSYKNKDHRDLPFSQQLIPRQLKSIENLPQTVTKIINEMNLFINDSLKALSTAITGIKSPDDLIPCSSWSCLQNALQRYPFTADEKKLIRWDRSYEFDFMGNPILFYRIIFNLIKNSLYQIHKNGQGEIYITADLFQDFNLLKIKDTAGNVTEENIKIIFDEFQSSKVGGTGVGLAFCKLAMQSMGGDIECRKADGDKIEFQLSFPRIAVSV